jgi:hypothetical protein
MELNDAVREADCELRDSELENELSDDNALKDELDTEFAVAELSDDRELNEERELSMEEL